MAGQSRHFSGILSAGKKMMQVSGLMIGVRGAMQQGG